MREKKLYQLIEDMQKELQRIVDESKGIIVLIKIEIKAQYKPTKKKNPC